MSEIKIRWYFAGVLSVFLVLQGLMRCDKFESVSQIRLMTNRHVSL